MRIQISFRATAHALHRFSKMLEIVERVGPMSVIPPAVCLGAENVFVSTPTDGTGDTWRHGRQLFAAGTPWRLDVSGAWASKVVRTNPFRSLNLCPFVVFLRSNHVQADRPKKSTAAILPKSLDGVMNQQSQYGKGSFPGQIHRRSPTNIRRLVYFPNLPRGRTGSSPMS